MTTGFIYAAVFYIASLACAAVGAYFLSDGNWERWFNIFAPIARFVGPLFFAPLGFVIGFFREKRKQRMEEADRYREEMMRRAQVARQMQARQKPAEPSQPQAQPQAQHTSIFQPLTPPVQEQQPQELSDEVKAFLKQTSRVDTKGIREFVQQTRRYKLSDLHREANQEGSQG